MSNSKTAFMCGMAAMVAFASASASTVTNFAVGPAAFDPKGGHIQGIAASDDALYVAQMTRLVKVDWTGKVLATRPVQSHTGDIAWHDGSLYTSVAVYPERKEGRIQVFDRDLRLVRETVIDRTIDGIAYADGVLYVGMGAKEQPSNKPHRVNMLGRFDAKTLKEIAPRAEFDYGYETKFGFQDIVFDGERLVGSFYAVPGSPGVVFFDKNLNVLGTASVRCNQGFDILPPSMRREDRRFVRATTKISKDPVSVSCEFDFFDLNAAMSDGRAAPQIDGTSLLYLSHVHRGGGKLERPDNTLETFKWCWENGSALECDCRKTKDGVGIMLHDKTLKRTGRGVSPEMAAKLVSEELTWNEIKDVDVGSYLKEVNPAAADHSNERIPTIEATFAAMRGNPTWLCFVDEKGAGPEYIAKKAVEAGVQDQIYYTGPSHEKIFEWNKVLPGGKSLLWLGAWPKNHGAAERERTDKWFRDAMAKLREKDFKYISCISIHSYYDPTDPVDPFVPSTKVLKDMVAEFHAHGIPVCSIPFQGGETEEVYFKLFDLGFDGFSTDYPSVMFSVIRKLKARARTGSGQIECKQ